MSNHRCAGPRCDTRVRRAGATCSTSCAVSLGHTRREGAKARQLHRCALDGCREWVPRREGEYEAKYRNRRYHSAECRLKGRGQRRTKTRAPWRLKRRRCALDGCPETFLPDREAQRYHSHPCSVAARRPRKERETKVCQCPCRETFTRPDRMDNAAWTKRRFIDNAHRARGGWVQPGDARAGKRRAPSPKPSRDRKPKTSPPPEPLPVFAEPPPPVTWRPPAPTVVRVARVAPRPAFGLTRRRAG